MYKYATHYASSLAFFTFAILLPLHAFAQLPASSYEDGESVHVDVEAQRAAPSHIISFSPSALFLNTASFHYEERLSHELSLTASAAYTWTGGFLHLPVYGPDLDVGAIWYPSGFAPAGFFVNPKIGYASFTAPSEAASVSFFGIGSTFGYAWMVGQVVQIKAGIGAAYTWALAREKTYDSMAKVSGFLPTGQLSIGYAF